MVAIPPAESAKPSLRNLPIRIDFPLSRYVKAIRNDSMTDLLTHFRRTLEYESGGPIQELDQMNAAMLINDLCVFLGLSDQNRRKILGAHAAMFVDATVLESARSSLKQ